MCSLRISSVRLDAKIVNEWVVQFKQKQVRFANQISVFGFETEGFIETIHRKSSWESSLVLWLDQYALFMKELYNLKHGVRSFLCHVQEDDDINRPRGAEFMVNLCNDKQITCVFNNALHHSKLAVVSFDGIMQEIRAQFKFKNTKAVSNC
jgi:hypothetical protein